MTFSVFMIVTVLGQIMWIQGPIPREVRIDECEVSVEKIQTQMRSRIDEFSKTTKRTLKPDDLKAMCIIDSVRPKLSDWFPPR